MTIYTDKYFTFECVRQPGAETWGDGENVIEKSWSAKFFRPPKFFARSPPLRLVTLKSTRIPVCNVDTYVNV